MRKKKIGKIKNTIMNFRENYNNIFENLDNEIGVSCYSDMTDEVINIIEIESLNIQIKIENYYDTLREIKKQLIKNNLFLAGYRIENKKIIIETENDIYNLLFVSRFNEKDDYEELEEIREEIKKEE